MDFFHFSQTDKICFHLIFHKNLKKIHNLWTWISQQPEELERWSLFLYEHSFSTLCGRINYTGQNVGEHINFDSIMYCLLGVLERCHNWEQLREHSHKIWKINIHSMTIYSSRFLKDHLSFLKKYFSTI